MSKNEIHLHLIPGRQSELDIHVTYQRAQSIEAYLFSSANPSFARTFVRWLRRRTDEPVSELHFNLTGNDDKKSPLSNELRKAGATVRQVS